MFETHVSFHDPTQTFNWGSLSEHFIGIRIAKAHFGNRKFTGHNDRRNVQTCRTFSIFIGFAVFVVVDCGCTSHSAIFQLYSDRTDVQFPILTCSRAPLPWAARGLKRAEPTLTRAPGRLKTSFTSLPSEGPHAVRVSGESNPDLPIQSPARYLCATAAGSVLPTGPKYFKNSGD